jgi:hypothetical protein
VLVLDFGHFELTGKGRIDAAPGSGKVWSVSPAEKENVMASISFEKDIKPTLARSLYRDAMAWRLDLGKL